jgi:ferredoxin
MGKGLKKSTMKIAIYYYSGTGNTKSGVEHMKKCFEKHNDTCELISICDNPSFEPERYDLLGFASPVYHGFPAKVMIDFIGKISCRTKELPAFTILCPCFNLFELGYWGAKEHFYEMLAEKNIRVLSESGFFGEASHPVIRTFFLGPFIKCIGAPCLSKGRPDSRDTAAISDLSETIKKKFNNYKSGIVPKLPHSKIKKWISTNVVFPFVEYCNKHFLIKSVDTKKCTGCGACSKVCPVNAITLNDYPVFLTLCIHCQNCIIICPNDAFKYNTLRKVNQYRSNYGIKESDTRDKTGLKASHN